MDIEKANPMNAGVEKQFLWQNMAPLGTIKNVLSDFKFSHRKRRTEYSASIAVGKSWMRGRERDTRSFLCFACVSLTGLDTVVRIFRPKHGRRDERLRERGKRERERIRIIDRLRLR